MIGIPDLIEMRDPTQTPLNSSKKYSLRTKKQSFTQGFVRTKLLVLLSDHFFFVLFLFCLKTENKKTNEIFVRAVGQINFYIRCFLAQNFKKKQIF